jgi:hypothetical protein
MLIFLSFYAIKILENSILIRAYDELIKVDAMLEEKIDF